jgi:hypothetical protein
MNEASINAKNVGIRLPNGKIKMMKAANPSDANKEFESDEEFYNKFPNINEGSGDTISNLILDIINE